MEELVTGPWGSLALALDLDCLDLGLGLGLRRAGLAAVGGWLGTDRSRGPTGGQLTLSVS